MSRGFALLAILLVVAVGNAFALDTNHKLFEQDNRDNLTDKFYQPAPSFMRDDPDTIYYGGDDGAGNAVEGGVWDFDTIVSDPFQGFTSVDRTENLDTYFYRVEAADFVAHGDGCTPMIEGTLGQIWCGIHEDDANERDFIAGLGYQNNMCQSAFSPMIVGDPNTNDIVFGFDYFNDTEDNFDYTRIIVQCYDTLGDPVVDGEVELELLTGIVGDYVTPEAYSYTVSAGILPAETTQFQLEIRMTADGGWSDEDGDWDTDCGPFGADDITIAVGATTYGPYTFDAGEEGWTFSKCEGVGAFMAITEEALWYEWLEAADLTCDCTLAGNAISFNDTENSVWDPPGHAEGQEEEAVSGLITRTYDPTAYNAALMLWSDFLDLPQDRGTFYRIGYKYFPFSTEANPTPHWSARMGQNSWWYADKACGNSVYNLSTLGGGAGDPLPNNWTQMRIVYETTTDSPGFGQTPGPDEGNNGGTPVVDNLQAAVTGMADAPAISNDFNGANHQDGFGQNFPTYLEPSDVGNANVTLDLSGINDLAENDWLGDTAVVSGPTVDEDDPLTYWDVKMCFKVTTAGPRQNMIPEYLAWKNRVDGDPEAEFCCVVMDSIDTTQGPYANKFVTYAREDDPYFDQSADELTEAQEILPDGIWTPGTRIEYYYASSWTHVPDPEEYIYPPFHQEFEILPRMRLSERGPYTVEWPSVLYIDAFNRGVEYYVYPTMNEILDIEFDKYDYLDSSSNWKAPLHRNFSPDGPYNPGGYGNNGCTVEQLAGYRLIFVNTGSFGVGGMEVGDFVLFDGWLEKTDCDLPGVRRGIIFDGDQIAELINENPDFDPYGPDFLSQQLGATFIESAYRTRATDPAYCVALGMAAGATFALDNDTNLFGNGCPNEFNYNVLGVQGGVTGASGNLIFDNGIAMDPGDFSQIIRDNTTAPYNWRSVINGFSIHHLSQDLCGTGDCSADSQCVVEGAANMLAPAIEWIVSGADPFDAWLYPCTDTAVEEDPVNHSSIAVNFLRGASPNPFRTSATIRFSLAQAGKVDFSIYDVSGRLVKSLGENEFVAGENTIVWDGTNNHGNHVNGGIFWMQMNTEDGFSSGKKMLVVN